MVAGFPVPIGPMNRLLRTLAFPCLLAAVLTFWLRWQPLSSPDSGFIMELNLLSPVSGQTWLRFNTGDGWNFRDTRVFSIVEGAQPRTYRVALPPGVYKSFRILPPDASTAQVLTGARLLDADGTVVGRFSPARYTPAINAIPFALDQPLRLTAPWEKSWAESALDFAILAVVFGLLGALLARRAGAFAESASARWRQAASWFQAHPGATLLAVAALAVAASCHPVVFFGRSFVSPNNGALMLYDVHPSLPGAPVAPVEQWSGSDINATPWAHLPYSMITHEAVFAHGELPLWNRYGMCGVTLLGQGQSMPGDPLHWLTVCADGAAWAWDLRFLLAKTLFAFGIGLLVWKTSRHLPVAALLAFSSAFIGFFSYRFNHPAFFSLCYAPWILLCWLHAAAAPTPRAAARWAFAVLAANWLELNSGTAKEAAMLILGMNGTGALVLVWASDPARWRKLAAMSAGCLAFVALSAPLWMVLLDALKNGFTIYDHPHAQQLTPGLAIGLFDDLFLRQLMPNEWHADPALNFLALGGVLWALADARRVLADPTARAVALAAVPVLALVFGVVPPAWIDGWPFVKNIIHVDDTFICTLIVQLLLIAGFGLRSCLEKMRSGDAWRGDWACMLALLGGLAALYFGSVQAMPRSDDFGLRLLRPTHFSAFFTAYAAVLLAGVALLPWLARRLVLGRGARATTALAVVVILSALHFRHGMWLDTKFDIYVMNPQQRVHLQARSPAADFVRARQAEPSRVLGFGQILRPGFNPVLHLETPTGVDAVMEKLLAQWYGESGLGEMSLWWPAQNRDGLEKSRAFYDAMNVRYYFGSTSAPDLPLPGLKKVARADLEVFESETAWPRAFFTDRVAHYRDVPMLATWILGGDRRPFAAVQEGDPGVPALSSDQTTRQLAAARDYRLTSNTTSFTVDAPGAGVAVLTESFVPDGFRARINGQPAPILRVNHVFKAVALPAAGTYRIEFAYWPRILTPALSVALAGALSVLGCAAWLWKTRRPAADSGTVPANAEVRASLTTCP